MYHSSLFFSISSNSLSAVEERKSPKPIARASANKLAIPTITTTAPDKLAPATEETEAKMVMIPSKPP